MTDHSPHPALLPAGLSDLLSPQARREAEIIHRVMSHLEFFGYERIKPPLVEFEDSLLSGIGEKQAMSSLRMMDPDSQRVMALRSDITVQAARIAATRLARVPRPLRLSYCGEVLRACGDQLRPERQFCQVGVELIGSDCIAADAEVVMLAVSALVGIGITDLTVDVQMPTLASALIEDFGLDEAMALRLTEVLDRKDSTAIPQMESSQGHLVKALMDCVGPVDTVLTAFQSLDLPERSAREARRLVDTVTRLRTHLPDLSLTIDPVEQRSLDYHTGLTFAIYTHRSRNALGLGGRYRSEVGNICESATGFTLFLDMLLRAVSPGHGLRRIYVPRDCENIDYAQLQAEGYAVIRQLDDGDDDPLSEAQRLSCEFVYDQGKIVKITQADRSVSLSINR